MSYNVTDLLTQTQSWSILDYATIAGLFFGIVTTLAYYDQRRSSKKYEALFKIVEQSNDFKESQEKIVSSREEIKQLNERRQNLIDQVKKDIPNLARIAAWREQAKVHADSTAKTYLEWKKVTKELKEIPHEAEIDQLLLDEVTSLLVPEYEQREARDALRDKITILSFGFVFLNSLMYNIFELLRVSAGLVQLIEIGNVVLALLLVTFAVKFIRLLYGDLEIQKFQNIIKKGYAMVYVPLFVLGFAFIIFAGMNAFDFRGNILFSIVFVVIGIGILTLGIRLCPKVQIYLRLPELSKIFGRLKNRKEKP